MISDYFTLYALHLIQKCDSKSFTNCIVLHIKCSTYALKLGWLR